MRILILGAGAVGLAIAAKLSKYAEVFAVCRDRYSASIDKNGFYLSGIWGTETYRFSCGTIPPKGTWDYIIISTKASATREICEQYVHLFCKAQVVSLQNGIGNEEIIASYRVFMQSATGKKRKLIKPQFLFYYRYQGLGLFKSIYYTTYWAFHGLLNFKLMK